VLPPRELRDDCPEELNALILKAMLRPPDERFQSATEMARQLEQMRSALRIVPNVGMQILRKPMPRREDRATRARRMPRKVAESASAAPTPSTVTVDEETIPTLRPPAVRGRGMLIWVSALIVIALLGVASTLALRKDEHAAPPLEAAAAVPAPPPPLPKAEAPEIAPVAPVAAAAPAQEPESDASTAAPRTSTVVTAPKTPRARRAKRDRQVQADAPLPAASAVEPASDEPAGPTVQEQLAEASSAFVLGQVPRAKALYQQILERSPSQPEAWRGLGLASSRMGLVNDAERAFERYLKLRPNAPDAERVRDQLAKIRGQP